jgi:hypothetical protein
MSDDELEKLFNKTEKTQEYLDNTKDSFTTQGSVDIAPWWSVSNAMTTSAAVLVFGCLILVLVSTLLYKGRSADDLLKIFGTIVIVIFATFLVVAGYSNTQIAPVIGLLGTIAGYLLGSRDKDVEKKDGDDK